jgi:hypothetical protein
MTSTGHGLNLQSVNCCIPGLLFKCAAGVTWAEHSVCRFSKNSSFSDRCLYYNEATDGNCDCMDAQIALVEN